MLKDAGMTLVFYVRFNPLWISNIHSSIAVGNRTYSCMFIWHLWLEVSGLMSNEMSWQTDTSFHTQQLTDVLLLCRSGYRFGLLCFAMQHHFQKWQYSKMTDSWCVKDKQASSDSMSLKWQMSFELYFQYIMDSCSDQIQMLTSGPTGMPVVNPFDGCNGSLFGNKGTCSGNKPCQQMGALACRGAASHAQTSAPHSVPLPWPLQALWDQTFHLPVIHSAQQWTQPPLLELGPANSQAVPLLTEPLRMTLLLQETKINKTEYIIAGRINCLLR